MRHKIVLVSSLLWFCAFSCGAKDAKDLIHYQVDTSNRFATIHILTIDPKDAKVIAARAQDVGHGLCNVAYLAKQYKAIAAINGGFFRVNRNLSINGVPAGILKLNNAWHGIAYKPRGAIAWDPETNSTLIDIVQTQSAVLLHGQTLPVNAMNKLVRGNDKATLFSDSFADPVIADLGLSLIIMDQRIAGIYASGVLQVPQNAYVYHMSPGLAQKLSNVTVGDGAQIKIQVQPQMDASNALLWNKMPYIVGGGPLLIQAGKPQYDLTQEQMDPEFILGRHARTAIGMLADKRLVFIVAERDIFNDKPGLTIAELRDVAFNLGCVAALNLDGGSSTSMYIEDIKRGAITDQPVADAILIVSR